MPSRARPFGQSAGELVDDHDLAVVDHVLPVEDELPLHLDRPLDVAVDVEHADRVHRLRLGKHADLLPAFAGQFHALLVVVVFVILVLDKLLDDLGAPFVALDRQPLFLGRQSTDDQRRAGFVDQNAIGFVDQGEIGVALHGFLAPFALRLAEHASQKIVLPFADPPQQEAVAEEVEAELLGRAVGHVAGIGLARCG